VVVGSVRTTIVTHGGPLDGEVQYGPRSDGVRDAVHSGRIEECGPKPTLLRRMHVGWPVSRASGVQQRVCGSITADNIAALWRSSLRTTQAGRLDHDPPRVGQSHLCRASDTSEQASRQQTVRKGTRPKAEGAEVRRLTAACTLQPATPTDHLSGWLIFIAQRLGPSRPIP
jgi:hypothetical protein